MPGEREDAVAIEAHVELFGFGTRPAVLLATPRSRTQRYTRASATLVGFWALVPLVFFIPPHIEWAVLVFLTGAYQARKQWRGEFHVFELRAECPACGAYLALKPQVLKLPHALHCSCLREPVLELGRAPERVATGESAPLQREPPSPEAIAEARRREHERKLRSKWSPASSSWRD